MTRRWPPRRTCAGKAPNSSPASTAAAATNFPTPSPPRHDPPAPSGSVRGRRGIYADNTLDLGPSAALDLDGIAVVVLSNRYQCADPVFFEAFGLDIAAARVVVVKSRGHFRGGFDEFFRHQDIVEVDAPGLTSPILSRFAWRHMPRPVLPIDDHVLWNAPWDASSDALPGGPRNAHSDTPRDARSDAPRNGPPTATRTLPA